MSPNSRNDRPFDDAEAERLWEALFLELPEVLPPAGFADRVMFRLAPLAPLAPAPSGLFAGLGARLALAACLFLGGLSVAAASRLAPWAWAVARELDPMGVVTSSFALLTEAVVRGIARGAATWNVWNTLADAASRLLLRPESAIAAGLALILAAAALRWLDRLLVSERSSSHA